MIAWITANYATVLTVLLVASEAAAAITQLLVPSNKGLSGALATVIKILQKLTGKDGSQAPAA